MARALCKAPLLRPNPGLAGALGGINSSQRGVLNPVFCSIRHIKISAPLAVLAEWKSVILERFPVRRRPAARTCPIGKHPAPWRETALHPLVEAQGGSKLGALLDE